MSVLEGRSVMTRRARRVLVTWGSKMGGTEGIGRIVGQTMEARGLEVVAASVDEIASPEGFDVVIVGGGLYGNRWPANVRRFVRRNVEQLRAVPVWFFSSGPLDDSADRSEIPAPNHIAALAERVGAKGHVTFGGRLERNARGFPASAMAEKSSGDWRNPDRIRAWAATIAAEIPEAVPGRAIDHPARSLTRLVGHALLGWALCAVSMLALERVVGLGAASSPAPSSGARRCSRASPAPGSLSSSSSSRPG
jgi:menaquinone-dependent protoporphyrinogen oxidase